MSVHADAQTLVKSFAHPFESQIFEVADWILNAEVSIESGIKWNSLSFRTTEWFATLNKNAKDRVELVFHLGAKVRKSNGLTDFPAKTLTIVWKSADRCLVSIPVGGESDECRQELQAFVRQWVASV